MKNIANHKVRKRFIQLYNKYVKKKEKLEKSSDNYCSIYTHVIRLNHVFLLSVEIANLIHELIDEENFSRDIMVELISSCNKILNEDLIVIEEENIVKKITAMNNAYIICGALLSNIIPLINRKEE